MTHEIRFRPLCKSCEQIERNQEKNIDRPLAILEQRAAAHAMKAGKPRDYFWIQMGYWSLEPYMRAAMSEAGVCQSCGHKFLNERDIQFDHIEPPRFREDWARLHARNIVLRCQSCNGSKSSKSYAAYLDEAESARIANERHRAGLPVTESTSGDEEAWLPGFGRP